MEAQGPQGTPPGWYPNPQGPGQRYWEVEPQWTGDVWEPKPESRSGTTLQELWWEWWWVPLTAVVVIGVAVGTVQVFSPTCSAPARSTPWSSARPAPVSRRSSARQPALRAAGSRVASASSIPGRWGGAQPVAVVLQRFRRGCPARGQALTSSSPTPARERERDRVSGASVAPPSAFARVSSGSRSPPAPSPASASRRAGWAYAPRR